MARKHIITGTAALAAIIAAGSFGAPITNAATPVAGQDVSVRGTTLKAMIVNPTAPVTGTINADGYDIAVYFGPGHSGIVDADISGATWYGVVADRANVNVTGSQVHDIGANPEFNGAQHGRAILYTNGADGMVSGNKVFDFQKNGIEVSGENADATGRSSDPTNVTVKGNVVTGRGPIDTIAQNGIVVRDGAKATVKDNTVTDVFYTPDTNEAIGLLNYNDSTILASGNKFVDTEMGVYGAVTAIVNVRGSSAITVFPHRVRVDLKSAAQPANSVLGSKLDWKVKVDGKTVVHHKQGFDGHYVYRRDFAANSGRHVIKVFKNDVLVRTAIVRA